MIVELIEMGIRSQTPHRVNANMDMHNMIAPEHHSSSFIVTGSMETFSSVVPRAKHTSAVSIVRLVYNRIVNSVNNVTFVIVCVMDGRTDGRTKKVQASELLLF